MSKGLTKVAMIAGAVALVATGVGAAAGAGIGFGAAGSATATAAAATASSIASYASLAATVASIGAMATAKKPAARGTVNQVLIAADAPAPYLIGRTYYAGVLRHDWGYGEKRKKVKNPYRGMVLEYSVAGPLTEMEGFYFDYQQIPFTAGAATGYYADYLYLDYRMGARPDTALTPHFAGFPHWGSDYKLSGKACALVNMLFDKKGKRFAGGVPTSGIIWKGVPCYDPRKDSTYPGGSGSHRWADPRNTAAFAAARLTWEYSECPGLNGLRYALGSWERDETDPAATYQKVFGIGLPTDGIAIEDFVALANVCDANGWTCGGVLFEPGSKGANLKDILQAGAAEWLFRGGKLGVKINAPRVSLAVITPADLADDDAEIPAMQPWPDRKNGLIPKYRSEAHKWEYVASDLVSVPAYVTQDGERKEEERQLNLVQDKDQAAQIIAYELVNGRELAGMTLVCKPHLRRYGPGDMLTLQLPEHGLPDMDVVIIERSVDPSRMAVTFSLMSETAGKHAFALGQTGTAPPVPALLSPADKDGVASSVAGNDIDAPTALTVTPGTGTATVAWRNATSNDLDKVNIYVATTASPPGTPTMTVNASGLGAMQTQAVSVAAGLKYFWAQSVSDDGYTSDLTGPISATIT